MTRSINSTYQPFYGRHSESARLEHQIKEDEVKLRARIHLLEVAQRLGLAEMIEYRSQIVKDLEAKLIYSKEHLRKLKGVNA